MEKQKPSLRKRVAKGLAGITCAGVFLGSTLMGCATSGSQGSLFGNYGNLKSSKDVTRSFKNYELKPDHTYFIAGSKKESPDAILALDNQYILDNPRFWRLFNSQGKTLEKLVKNMKNTASESQNIPYGADILDHNGNDIGDWYSTSNTTTIRTKDGKTFSIYTPNTRMGGGGSGGSGGSGSGGGGSGQ